MDKPITQVRQSETDSETLVDRTMTDFRQYIRYHKLRPGNILPGENTLSQELGVSRTVTREAFRALATLGILEVGNARKARVVAPDAMHSSSRFTSKVAIELRNQVDLTNTVFTYTPDSAEKKAA